MARVILGIDPGRYVGWCIAKHDEKNFKVVRCGWFNCGWVNAKDRGSLLVAFSRFIAGLIKRAYAEMDDGDDGVSVRYERPFFRGRAAESLHQYETCILLESARAECDVRYVNPITLKKVISGNGRSDKHQMFLALKREIPDFDFRDINGNPINDDTVDAICVALYDARYSEG